jgi:DNA-binding CsgD family transcriptional regulator
VNGFYTASAHSHAGARDVVVVSLEKARARRHLIERAYRLSGRERMILSGLAQGHATEEIAHGLVLSPHTVRSHVKTAMRKLDARTRAHAVAIALTTGVIDPA